MLARVWLALGNETTLKDRLLRLRLCARQLISAFGIPGRHVGVQGSKQRSPGAFDLVQIFALDEKQRAGLERRPLAIYESGALAGQYIQPLVYRAMAIPRTPFGVGRYAHSCNLRACVCQGHSKALAKSKSLFFHAEPCAKQ
jgi:hypothetical protein